MKRDESQHLSDDCLARLCRVQLPYVTDSYERLFQRYQAVVLRTCHRYLGSREEAEEACQDVFLSVFRSISQFEGRSSFRTWLYRIVFNTCSTRREKLQKKFRIELTNTADPQTEACASREEGGGLVERALDELMLTEKEILLLRFEAELSLDEIAKVVGSKLSATKMRLYRATERFRTVYINLKKQKSA